MHYEPGRIRHPRSQTGRVYLIPLLAFDAFCLADLARASGVNYLPKPWWALAICWLPPFGGIAYLSAGRHR